MAQHESLCYLNGSLLPLSKAMIPASMLGTQIIYDSARTYGGKCLFLSDHIERLFQGCHYFGFDLGLNEGEFEQAVIDTVNANLNNDHIAAGGDYLIDIKVTGEPTILINTPSLIDRFRERGHYYTDGLHAVVASAQRHVPAQCIDPRLKVPRPWFQLAIRETRLNHPEAWPFPLMMDLHGNVAEFATANYFIVVKDELHTPCSNILLGCSRDIVIKEAKAVGIRVIERDINLYDIYNADEMMMSATTYGLMPVNTVNGVGIGPSKGFGPVGEQLMTAYSKVVGLDLRSQYLKWAQSCSDS